MRVIRYLTDSHPAGRIICTAVLREAWATLPESSNRPLPATLAQSRNLAHASLETAVCWRLAKFGWPFLGLPFLPHTTMAVRSPPTRTKYPASPPPSRAFSLFSCQLAVGCQIKCLSLSLSSLSSFRFAVCLPRSIICLGCCSGDIVVASHYRCHDV